MNWLYRFIYILLLPVFKVLYRYKAVGTEHLPEGAAILCANHSGYSDPLLVDLCCGLHNCIHFMAKKSLMDKPILGAILRKAGTFGVDRGTADVEAIRTAMRYLKNGEKIGIFPEGTRVANDGDIAAKAGAIRIAAKTGVPIVPIYIPRNKKFFRRHLICFGEPYTVQVDRKSATAETYNALAQELMEKIDELRPR